MIEVTQSALIDAIISAYHTTRLRDAPVADHILSKDRVKALFAGYDAAAEQRGMIAARDAAVKVAQGMVCYGEEDGSAEYDTACRMIAQAIATMPMPLPMPMPMPDGGTDEN